jgi:hypothetical protein
MKRSNPKTNNFFKFGDTRNKDNLIFKQYNLEKIDKNGYFYETWIIKKPISKPKRLNPNTQREWVYGDIDERGMYFIEYKKYPDKEGHPYMSFANENSYIKKTITQRKNTIVRKCNKQNIPYDKKCLSTDYLVSIFPKDWLCPVFGVKMLWGKNNDFDSPSLDRFIPCKGYIKNNVSWISERANRVKTDATLQEVLNVAKWMEQKQ